MRRSPRLHYNWCVAAQHRSRGTMPHPIAILILGHYFFWILGNAAPTTLAPPTDDSTTLILGTQLPEVAARTCTTDEECKTDHLFCDRKRGSCACRDMYATLSRLVADTCLPAKQLGEDCQEDVQCRVLDEHALCTNGFCACDSGFYQLEQHNGTLCGPAGAVTTEAIPAATAGNTQLDLNMIAVICALAVMFIGICVALHLFSRARFRNRRTIFNSPHPRLMHIKLGKKKKKKLTGSQHLSTPVHHPNVPRHHSFSGHYVASPLPLHKVSKTRSHECLRSAVSHDSSPRLEMRFTPRAPLAEKESSSVPSTEDLDKKTPDAILPNGVVLLSEEAMERPPGSPTVIITDADGSHHQVVSSSRPSPTNGNAV